MKSRASVFAHKRWPRGLIFTLSVLALILSACGGGAGTGGGGLNSGNNNGSSNVIKLGVLTINSGPLAALGQDGLRGVQMALDEFNNTVAGKKIVVSNEYSDATPNVARDSARKLIEQDGVDLMVGPLSGDEGLAVRDYAKTQPGKVFLNGSSAAEDTTLRNGAPNFFRFNTEAVQWMYPLGSYVYNTQGYKHIAILAEDYSFPYAQVGGFMTGFCQAGGHVVKKSWVPLGTTDYSSVVSQIPANIDAIFVALGGSDAINFLRQYVQFGGKAKIIGGAITVDQSVLGTKGSLVQHLVGVASASNIADNNPDPAWQAFVKTYKSKFPNGFPSPSNTALAYYVNTKAALTALQQVNGDLSNGEQKLKDTLAGLSIASPTGTIKLDSHHQAIGNSYITVVSQNPDGSLYNKLVVTTPNVDETLGMPEDQYLKLGPFTRDTPSCP